MDNQMFELTPEIIVEVLFETIANSQIGNTHSNVIGTPIQRIPPDNKFRRSDLLFRAFTRIGKVVSRLTGAEYHAFPDFGGSGLSGIGESTMTFTGTILPPGTFQRVNSEIESTDLLDRMRRVHELANSREMRAGLPAFFADEQILLPYENVDCRDVAVRDIPYPVETFGDSLTGYWWFDGLPHELPPIFDGDATVSGKQECSNAEARFYAMSAGRKDSAAAYPNGHEATYDKVAFFGAILIKEPCARPVEIYWRALDAIGSDFDFGPFFEFVPTTPTFALNEDRKVELRQRFGDRVSLPGAD